MMCVGDRTPFCLPVGVRWRGQHYGCAPAPLLVSVVTFSFLPPRPLASTVNDKLELQECLEHGRIAKVSPAPEPSAGGAGAGLGVGGGRAATTAVSYPPSRALGMPGVGDAMVRRPCWPFTQLAAGEDPEEGRSGG